MYVSKASCPRLQFPLMQYEIPVRKSLSNGESDLNFLHFSGSFITDATSAEQLNSDKQANPFGIDAIALGNSYSPRKEFNFKESVK